MVPALARASAPRSTSVSRWLGSVVHARGRRRISKPAPLTSVGKRQASQRSCTRAATTASTQVWKRVVVAAGQRPAGVIAVEHRQRSARLEHPEELAQALVRARHVGETSMSDGDVESGIPELRPAHVAGAEGHVRELAGQLACLGQKYRRRIDAHDG